MKLEVNAVFYKIGQWIWIPFLLIGLWFAKYGYGHFHQLFECSFYAITGLPCPGCGGTRAFYYLFSGDFISSFRFHPVVIYGVLAYIHFMGLYFYRHHLSKKKLTKEIQIPVYLYLAIGVILFQWLVKILKILL
ncbi:MAG: DUF2752 domain-containing protein [Suilimivivens sp.]